MKKAAFFLTLVFLVATLSVGSFAAFDMTMLENNITVQDGNTTLKIHINGYHLGNIEPALNLWMEAFHNEGSVFLSYNGSRFVFWAYKGMSDIQSEDGSNVSFYVAESFYFTLDKSGIPSGSNYWHPLNKRVSIDTSSDVFLAYPPTMKRYCEASRYAYEGSLYLSCYKDLLKDFVFTPPPDTYTLTVNYQYEDGTKAADSNTSSLRVGAAYNVVSPKITGYTAGQGTVSGTMGEVDINITVTYKRNSHNLTVKYIYKNGLTAAPVVKKILGYGDAYNVVSPKVTGYSADQGTVSGIMGDMDITLTVIYQMNVHLLTIHYQYEDGSQAAPDVKKTLDYGAGYHVVSPKITGYTADQGTVSGAIGDADLTVTVTYKKYVPPKHTLTIHYQYEDGSEAAPDYTGQIPEGEGYSVLSPIVAGYQPGCNTVSGTMGTADITETVQYTRAVIDNYVPYNPDSWNMVMKIFSGNMAVLLPVLVCLFCIMLIVMLMLRAVNVFIKKGL